MAHTKSGGSTKLGRESASQRLGIKVNDGEAVVPGQIIVRQRGTRYLSGLNTKLGKDDTIYAAVAGTVMMSRVKKPLFNGSFRYASKVTIVTQPTPTQ